MVAVLLLGASPVSASHQGAMAYKGAETLELVSVAPNVARCGAAPNVEATFEGQGIDTAGGVFTVDASGCQNPTTGQIFDLVAVDSYATGDSVTIAASSFFLVFDPQICVSATAGPVAYTVAGGTGAFAGATGGGVFEFISNDPSCSGVLAPAFVAFAGFIQ